MDMEARAHSEHPEALRLWLRLLTCTQLVEKQVRSLLRERFDTTLPRFDLMAQLERSPGGLKMNELSRRMMVTGGNVTGITDQLVAESLVERVDVEGDRRAYRVPAPEAWPTLRYDLPELRIADNCNLVAELLDKAADKGWADRPLMRSARIVLSYADVRERVDRICRVLVEDFAMRPGHRVLLRGGNSIGMALAWLAVVKAGGIAVATMPLLRAGELRDIIDKSQPALALCDAKLLAELELARQDRPVLRDVIVFNTPNEPGPLAVPGAQKESAFEAFPVAPDRISL